MTYPFDIRQSKLHGVGLFANQSLKQGEQIGRMILVNVGRKDFFETLPTVGVVDRGNVFCPIAGFPLWAVNWSSTPNIACQRDKVFVLTDIPSGTELTIGYHEAPQ